MLVALTVSLVIVSCYIALQVTATILVCLIGSDDAIRGIGTPPEAVREYYESHFPPICTPKRYWLFVSNDD
jgi:hypothetical protein